MANEVSEVKQSRQFRAKCEILISKQKSMSRNDF